MKRKDFYKAGRLHHIVYRRDVVISIGERGYARLEVQQPSAATLRRLDALARRGFGSRPLGTGIKKSVGVIYRSPWTFLGALWRTQCLVWQAKLRAKRRRGRG